MRSILSKLWLGITGLVIIIIVLIWIFQIFFLNRFYLNERSNLLLNEGKAIASLIEKTENLDPLSVNIKDEIDAFTSSYTAGIIIFTPNQGVLYSSDSSKIFRDNINSFLNFRDIRRDLLSQKVFVKQNRIHILNATFITVGVPLVHNDEIVGTAILSSPVQPIKETITILRRQLTIITLLSIAIGTVLALILAKIFTSPIVKINQAAKQIAKGDFSSKVNIKSKDEIGVLGKTINNLSTQLGQTEKFRREFIANTSHELKTPISLIRAYAELVMETKGEEKKNTADYLNVIIDESSRLNNMVEDMLYLSKMEAGYYTPNLTDFNIIETIKKVLDKLSHIAKENEISLIKDFSADSIMVTADEDKIYQVILNLINNAIMHSTNDTTVIIKISDRQNMIRIEIIDNGIGIPEEDLPHIWDRFYKVDKSRQRNNTGTGLGMSIVKNILEAHNFKYGINSKVNKGTKIWIEMTK
ncbi:ATP-binding protein [Sporosalibacterium faouarense]|uniref:ATP-binding protein n=1 Tax=Sporosalibacterium faouarense TaxID=516123 RepID=UPI00141C9723|nr:ATP-binding protein [Sporosalibacterium faouarense]MTI48701.1 cell wall metabolism sensor histidine kinase WalK [Bacillota bacterium]